MRLIKEKIHDYQNYKVIHENWNTSYKMQWSEFDFFFEDIHLFESLSF